MTTRFPFRALLLVTVSCLACGRELEPPNTNPVKESENMKRTDFITITTVALGTATLTLATFWSGQLGAGAEGDALPPRIEKPRLVSHGIEFTLAAADACRLRAGDQPVLELTAFNTTDAANTGGVCATMTASSPADMLSRVVRMPAVVWQRDQFVSLGAKERKTLVLTTTTNLPPKSMISVLLRETQPPGSLPQKAGSVVALSFSTATQPVPGGPASVDELRPAITAIAPVF
jgi:hypothetical protein